MHLASALEECTVLLEMENKNSYYQHRDTCQTRAVSRFVRTPHVPREVGEGFSKEGTFKLVPEN